MKLCKDCKKEISEKSKRCRKCASIERGKKLIKHILCVDCGKELVNKSAKRCKSCANKGIKSGNYIDGRTNKTYYCKECKIKKIQPRTYFYRLGLCRSCVQKDENNSRRGKKQSKETCIKKSLARGGDGINVYDKIYNCIEPNCNNKISYSNNNAGTGRCLSCAVK